MGGLRDCEKEGRYRECSSRSDTITPEKKKSNTQVSDLCFGHRAGSGKPSFQYIVPSLLVF